MSNIRHETKTGIMQNIAERRGLAVFAASAALAGSLAVDSIRDKITGAGGSALVATSELLGADAQAQDLNNPDIHLITQAEHVSDCGDKWTRRSLNRTDVTQKAARSRVFTFSGGVAPYMRSECQFDPGDPGEGSYLDVGEAEMKLGVAFKPARGTKFRIASGWTEVDIKSGTTSVNKRLTTKSGKFCPPGGKFRGLIEMTYNPHSDEYKPITSIIEGDIESCKK